MSSFAIPRNIPSFNDPQRELENRAWGASGVAARPNGYAPSSSSSSGSNGLMSGVQDRMGGMFEKRPDLPMYKDKPYSYASSSRRRAPWWQSKRIIGAGLAFVVVVLYILGVLTRSDKRRAKAGTVGSDTWQWLQGQESGDKVDWLYRRERVKEAFMLSWDAYERYAWGYDEFHPISKTGKQMAPGGMGWIIVDALDTLMIMNLTSRLTHAREWMTTKLDYDQNQEVNTFETTIRMLGGLLSAHYLSTTFPDMAPLLDDDEGSKGEDLYIEKAKDLADRLVSAFESPSGIPYASVNLKQLKGVPSHDDGGASSTAEAATLQLELKYLSKLTGERYYWDRAEKVMQVIDDNGRADGLLPIYIYAHSGQFRGDNIRLGSRGDSYYEYLIKQYLQTSRAEPVYRELWEEALRGVRRHLITYSTPAGFTVLGERPDGLAGELSPKMDHLVCFMPGTIALGVTDGLTEAEARALDSWSAQKEDEMRLARELTRTCWAMYRVMETGLAPEIAHFHVADPPPAEGAPHATAAGAAVAAAVPGEEEREREREREQEQEQKQTQKQKKKQKQQKDQKRGREPELDAAPDAEWRRDFNIKQNDVHNLQRPETVETLFYMWRITGDVVYREWGWEMFKSFMKYTAVEEGGGFTSLNNANRVDPPSQRDNMESFWLAETLKYFYLLFSPNDLLPLDQIVINTEAHPFPRFEMGPLFSTGWERLPRDAEGRIVAGAKRPAAAEPAAAEPAAAAAAAVVREEVVTVTRIVSTEEITAAPPVVAAAAANAGGGRGPERILEGVKETEEEEGERKKIKVVKRALNEGERPRGGQDPEVKMSETMNTGENEQEEAVDDETKTVADGTAVVTGAATEKEEVIGEVRAEEELEDIKEMRKLK